MEERRWWHLTKRKKTYTGRDYNIVSIINGATKAYIEKDHKKEANKKTSRTKVEEEEEERCLQCGFPYTNHPGKDKDERAAQECGYCSVSCMDYTTNEAT